MRDDEYVDYVPERYTDEERRRMAQDTVREIAEAKIAAGVHFEAELEELEELDR